MLDNVTLLCIVVILFSLDEMRAEQTKLQNQLNEFVKKQADYEEVCLSVCLCACLSVCVLCNRNHKPYQ